MKLRVDKEKFTHCLRIAIVPGHYEDERIESVLRFCLDYGLTNVMLFINAEEYNVGHMTIDEAKPWVETMKKAKKVFNANGISVSLNPWIVFGHLDRGRKLKPQQNYHTMVDMHGKACEMVACFLDANWRKNYLEYAGYLIKEIDSDVYWIEDDFRLHNHGDLDFGGCFCALHMQKYNAKAGTDYTREEFVKRAMAPGKPSRERLAWLDVSREEMRGIAETIGKAIAGCGLKTRVALMSSSPVSHSIEARDWHGITEGLSQGGDKINRIHLPCYPEVNGKNYYYDFNAVSMAVRAFLPKDTLIYPEFEIGHFSSYGKDSRFLRFQIESAIPLILSGMTYDIFDFVGNGAVETAGYGPEIKALTPYLQAVMDQKPGFENLTGVIVPIDERSCSKRESFTAWREMSPTEFNLAAYFSAWGINYAYSLEKEFKNKIVAISGGNAEIFTDAQLKALFENNFVFLDGGALLYLKRRGLGGLIGLKDAERKKDNINFQSYEQAEGHTVNGIKGYRASTQFCAGDYVRAGYENAPQVWSKLYSSVQEYVGEGIVGFNGFMVNPFVLDRHLYDAVHDLRKFGVYHFLQGCKVVQPLVFSNHSGLSPYLYEKKDKFILLLTNSTVNNFNKIVLTVKDLKFGGIQTITREGKLKNTVYKQNGVCLTINEPLEYLSTAAFVLTK